MMIVTVSLTKDVGPTQSFFSGGGSSLQVLGVWGITWGSSLGYPKGPKNLKKSCTWVMDSSFVGSYAEEYMIIRYLDP